MCPECNGTGRVTIDNSFGQSTMLCSHGKGKIEVPEFMVIEQFKWVCPICKFKSARIFSSQELALSNWVWHKKLVHG